MFWSAAGLGALSALCSLFFIRTKDLVATQKANEEQDQKSQASASDSGTKKHKSHPHLTPVPARKPAPKHKKTEKMCIRDRGMAYE